MLLLQPYRREYAYRYAQRWALGRNPLFLNFSGIGGDCTNFISQCLYAGSCVMNETPTFGWYYHTASRRTASWTGVQYLYDFLTTNEGPGPFAQEVGAGDLLLGDVIQLGDASGRFYHSLLVVGFTSRSYLVAAHSYDAWEMPLTSYFYDRARFLHIPGIRAWREPGVPLPAEPPCFAGLIAGERI